MNYFDLKSSLEKKYNDGTISDNEICLLANVLYEVHRNIEYAYEILETQAEKRKSFKILNNLGYYYLTVGKADNGRWYYRLEEAEIVFKRAIEIDENSSKSYSALGIVYLTQRNFEAAEKAFKSALTIIKSKANYNNLGVALFEQNKYEEALITFEMTKSISGDADYSYYPHYNHLLALSKNGKTEKSSYCFEEFCSLFVEKELGELDIIDLARLSYLFDDYSKVFEIYDEHIEKITVNKTDFSLYIYSMYKLRKFELLNSYCDKLSRELREEFNEAAIDDNQYKKEKVQKEIMELENMRIQIEQGYKPILEISPFVENECYLYECVVHNPI